MKDVPFSQLFTRYVIITSITDKNFLFLQELLQKVLDFEKDANIALNEERPDSEKLNKLVEFGVTLDVELPEISRLKQLLNQAKWLDEVKRQISLGKLKSSIVNNYYCANLKATTLVFRVKVFRNL